MTDCDRIGAIDGVDFVQVLEADGMGNGTQCGIVGDAGAEAYLLTAVANFTDTLMAFSVQVRVGLWMA